MDKDPSKIAQYNWYNEYKRGLLTLRDEKRSGHRLTGFTKRNVVALKNLIEAIR